MLEHNDENTPNILTIRDMDQAAFEIAIKMEF